MSASRTKIAAAVGGVIVVVGAVAVAMFARDPSERRRGERAPSPVEVAPIERGSISLSRTYGGTLEAPAQFVIASKVNGRVEKLLVDLADPVKRGQLVAQLDDDELIHLMERSKAELSVARARSTEAKSASAVAARELERLETLRGRGVASESQLDAVRGAASAQAAAVEVADAEVTRAIAELEAARIRLGYTRITASWSSGDDERFVAERFVHEGAMIAANAPLFSIVELDPLNAIVFVDERDYRHLQVGQDATLTTDAYPDERFAAAVARIAPVFQPGSRQARVELTVKNAQERLKPGMFLRATVVLRTAHEATIVPQAALTTRANASGVFLVAPDGKSVSWEKVEIGIQDGERTELAGSTLTGRVVTLGQQLVDDGAPIIIPGQAPPRAP